MIKYWKYQESLAGFVIQGAWTAEFEDELRMGVQLEVRIDPYSDCTNPMVKAYCPNVARQDLVGIASPWSNYPSLAIGSSIKGRPDS